jgi:transcriptional regulator with AAA-type ATPase domain
MALQACETAAAPLPRIGKNPATGVIYSTEGTTRVKQYPGMSDGTITTLSHSDSSGRSSAIVADELVLLLECDRPLAGSARHRLIAVDEIVIGRGTSRQTERGVSRLTLRAPDGRMSTQHAVIRREGLAYVITDERSKNGLIINGRRVDRHLLRDRDVIECGRTFFMFRMAQPCLPDAPLDLDSAQLDGAQLGLATFHEPLAIQLRALSDVARAQLPVLILGASGTGKELVARAVHALSQRRGPFIGVNCGALPENLVEAELFGARRGAFTGAHDDKPGLVRASDSGTLFLDEIGDLPLRAQPSLLRVLQEREVLSVGSTRALPVDLRVVAATHRDLDEMASHDRFRSDLLARLSGFIVRLPSLRERLEDLGLLIAALLGRHAAPGATLSSDAMRLLLRHGWALNVRELEHCLRGALAISPTRIDVEQLPRAIREPSTVEPSPAPARRRLLTPEQITRREELCALLAQHGRNISAVARQLGKDRVQIRRWIKQLDISLDEIAD